MQEFIDSLRRMFSLNSDYLRIRLAEKLSDAISMAILYIIIVFAAFMAIVFLSVGVGLLLAKLMPAWAAFICVAMLYVIGTVPLVAFRRKLFADGVSRMVTRLLIKPPTENNEEN